MTPVAQFVTGHVYPLAFSLLPPQMNSGPARVSGKISGAVERWKRSAAPHHNCADRSRASMADQKSSIPPVHSRSANGTALYEKRCTCGAVSIVDRRKLGKPCHACAMALRRTHGLATASGLHPLYALLKSMVARCTIASASHYAYYGGRGIRVCEEWLKSPGAFVSWAQASGWRPGLEIDRIDADGDYEPSNCRFLTHRENSQRTRRIRTTPEQAAKVRVEFDRGATIKQAAAAAGVSYMVAWHIKNSPGVWRQQ